MNVYFYLPEDQKPAQLPAQTDFTWKDYSLGKYCWGLQTYNRLQLAGVPCELTHTLPEEGVIIAHRAFLPDSIIPTRKQVLVCIQADWSRHPFAQLHICQNMAQTKMSGIPRPERFATGETYFVHHWPQPGMTPRDPARGNTFENIYYFGLAENLAPELKSDDWHQFMEENGLKWHLESSPANWRDYSQVDGVLFARDFTGKKHINKPASKLFNAWITGAIPICTPESAYVDEIENDTQAVVINNYDDLKAKLVALKNDPDRIRNMQQQGAVKAKQYYPEAIVQEWAAILEKVEQYRMSRGQYAAFIAKRSFSWLLCKCVRWLR